MSAERRAVWVAAALSACTPGQPAAPARATPHAAEVTVATPAPTPPVTSDAPAPERAPEPDAVDNAVDAGACEPLRGPDLVSRGSSRVVEATTRAECARCAGDWGPHGITGAVGCLCGTPDAGKPCVSPHDCVAACIVDEPGARELADACPAVGARFPASCAPRYVHFGCYGIVVEQQTPAGPLRGVRYLCLD